MRVALTLGLVSAIALSQPLDAQGRGRGKDGDGVPPGHLPPAGQCRIWYDGVPPGRQPAPTSCVEAERRAPRNARVVYGPRTSRGDDDSWWGRVYDGRDDRRDDRDGRYDPRYEDGRRRTDDSDARRRDGRYDPRYDPRNDSRYDPRYDSRSGYGALPTMLTVRELESRRWSAEVVRWVGARPARARWSDANRDGRPEQVWFLDSAGRVLQHWRDDSRDGRVDRVGLNQGGRLQRTVG